MPHKCGSRNTPLRQIKLICTSSKAYKSHVKNTTTLNNANVRVAHPRYKHADQGINNVRINNGRTLWRLNEFNGIRQIYQYSHAFFAQFANPTHRLRKGALQNANALTLTLVCRTNETTSKKIMVHSRPYRTTIYHAFSEAIPSMLLGQHLFTSNNIPK